VPPIFGRAAITLGIGPRSSCVYEYEVCVLCTLMMIMMSVCVAESAGGMLLQGDVDSESDSDVLRQPLLHSTNTTIIIGQSLVTLVPHQLWWEAQREPSALRTTFRGRGRSISKIHKAVHTVLQEFRKLPFKCFSILVEMSKNDLIFFVNVYHALVTVTSIMAFAIL